MRLRCIKKINTILSLSTLGRCYYSKLKKVIIMARKAYTEKINK